MHAISNGLIRQSSNVTRVFSVATVEVQVLHAADLDAAIATGVRVAAAMRDDAAWSDRFAEDSPPDVWVTALTVDGVTLRLQQRVSTGMQGPVASELRRRLALELAAGSITTGRWDTAMRISTEPGSGAGA